MNVWLFKHGETMPIQEGVRKMRTWMLAESLVERGHDVTWWSSTFSHQRKVSLAHKNMDVSLGPRFRLRMIHAGQYRKNVSFSRLIHHMRLGRGFAGVAAKYPKPDVIVCAYPVIDLAHSVAAYAKANQIPLIVDVRDQWPSTFLIVCPGWLKFLVYFYNRYLLGVAKRVFLSANNLVAMSQGCLKWAQQIAEKENLKDCVYYIGFSPRNGETDNAMQEWKMNELVEKVHDKLVFLYAGSFGSFYELSLIIDVARRCMIENLTDVHFVLAGDGEQLESLKKRAKDLENISFTGWLKSDEMHHLLKISHVGLLPYRDFGDGTFPNKPAEYFSYGLPVISSIDGEFADMVTNKALGINYQSGVLGELYLAIKTMRNNCDLRNQWSMNALKVFGEQFDARVIYPRYARYIEDVANTYLRNL